MERLNRQYESICNKFVEKFCAKQEIDFDGWVGEEVGGIASFACQYFFNLSDIILDLKSNQPKGHILNWQDEGLEFKQKINYKSYTMGLRYEHLKREVQQECEKVIFPSFNPCGQIGEGISNPPPTNKE